jgi:hypothetical protein
LPYLLQIPRTSSNEKNVHRVAWLPGLDFQQGTGTYVTTSESRGKGITFASINLIVDL